MLQCIPRLKLLQMRCVSFERKEYRRSCRDWRRIDYRFIQSDCLPYRSAADRNPDHLCRLGNDADSRSDPGRRENHAEGQEGRSRCRDLRRSIDALITRRKFRAPVGINAIAHAVEALYAENKNPSTSSMAEEGIARLARALPIIVDDPQNMDARTDALSGASLCGQCLATVGMALHHKLCHTLGGSFGLPHAENSYRTVTTRNCVQRYSRSASDAADYGCAWHGFRTIRPLRSRACSERKDGLARPGVSPSPTWIAPQTWPCKAPTGIHGRLNAMQSATYYKEPGPANHPNRVVN